ncbi:MAG: glycerate kinase type-2 family protein [Bacteroidota bacterium]
MSASKTSSLSDSLQVGSGGGRVGTWLARQMIATLESVSPGRAVQDTLSWTRKGSLLKAGHRTWSVGDESVWILGSGKAALSMASAAVQILGNSVHGGLVIAPAGETGKEQKQSTVGPVAVRYGSHPLPEEMNRESTDEMIELCGQIPEGALVLYLLSGGSSSLLCSPLDGVSIKDLRSVHQGLLRSGATIHEMNLVRKALSKVKAGQLLPRLAQTRLIDLIVSDVPGDSLSVIGSAPTTACVIETARAIELLRERGLWNDSPTSVRQALERSHSEHGSEWFVSRAPNEHEQILVASASRLAERGGEALRRNWPDSNGLISVQVARGAYREPIEEVSTVMAEAIQEAMNNSLPVALLWYGESTVNVTGNGKGGRNQELALRVAMEMERWGGSSNTLWTFVSLATDGVDGPTDSAGGVVHERTVPIARERGLDLNETLKKNDSWSTLEGLDAHIRSGPTGHNLMDLQVALIGVPQEQEIV